MSTDSQPNASPGQSQPQAATSSPAPYNPLTNGSHENQSSSIGNSVVHDLMRVYERMTQSSTPQVSNEMDGEPKSAAQPGFEGQQPSVSTYDQQPTQQPNPIQTSSSYAIPPPMYQPFPPSQQQGCQPQPYYYGDSPYNQPFAGMAPPTDHQTQHGQGKDEQQQQTAPDQDEEDGTESEEQQEGSGRSRRKRRGSDNSGSAGSRATKGRKKSKTADGRWSKRFTWPEDLHRDFVSAIFDVGLKHSSPSTILEQMPKHEQITTERIKSHLQKYRLHRVKSKKEFVTSYESSLRNFQNRGADGVKSISGGEVAAHLTFANMNDTGKGGTTPKGLGAAKPAEESQKENGSNKDKQNADALMLPQLTDSEKGSPIGAAMGYLMGLFFSLKQQLMIQRALESAEKNKSNAPVQDVFNSFVAGSAPGSAPAGVEINGDVAGQQQGYDGSNLKQPAPSARTNIEENSIMKREMESQMALQNKMRALKQQELNKYKPATAQQHISQGEEGKLKGPSEGQSPEEEEKAVDDATAMNLIVQGAGEMAGHDGAAGNRQRPRGLSIGASDEFWNTDVVDEQLFEFLMNT